MTTTITIDAMGGDHGLKVTVPAALNILQQHPDVKLILVGDEAAIQKELKKLRFAGSERLVLQHATEIVAMDEPPAKALRSKKDSSMRVAINLVQEGVAQACVSAGNTGALMATAHYVLKTLPGVDRPAIISTLPTLQSDKSVSMLDLGANADATAEHLYEFAVMGAVLASAHYNIAKPKVALLNIGVEQIKGNELVKAAHQLFTDNQNQIFDYIGYIEGDAIFKGIADVVVCDGFVGNITLKTIEGTCKIIAHYARLAFTRNIFSKIAALIAKPSLKYLTGMIDPRRHNGASFIGLKGIVIKSHGSADKIAFANAIYEAILEVEKNILQEIGTKVSSFLQIRRQTTED